MQHDVRSSRYPSQRRNGRRASLRSYFFCRLVDESAQHGVLCLPSVGKIEDFFIWEPQRFVMSLLVALVLSSCGRAGVSYHQTLGATYTLYPQLALPADLEGMLIEADDALGIDVASITVPGLDHIGFTGAGEYDPLANSTAIRVVVQGQAPYLTPLSHQYTGSVYHKVEDGRAYPAFNYTVYWYSAESGHQADVSVYLPGASSPISRLILMCISDMSFHSSLDVEEFPLVEKFCNPSPVRMLLR